MTNKFNVNQTRETLSKHDLLGSKGDELNKQAYMYNLLYVNHYDYLINIASNLFKWDGLPEASNGQKMRSSFFERILIMGKACICETKEFGVMISPCTVDGILNYWGNPTRLILEPPPYAEDFNFLKRTLDIANGDKFVFVRNDNFCSGFYSLLLQTTENLTVTYMSMLANINSQKFPFIFKGDKESRLTMEIIANKIDSYESYIMLKDNGSFDSTNLNAVVNKEMPFVADKLYESYTNILNNFFLRLGINNIPNQKKERMITDEVNANNQALETVEDVYLNCRKEACDEANEMFGLNLSVKRTTNIVESLIPNNPMRGGADDE